MLDRAWILNHIPHQGKMCLLDSVLHWDSEHIQCRASSHRNTNNPLRSRGQLGAACGIEYAAQAMAVHGALNALKASYDPPRPRAGFLVSVRGATLHIPRLDNLEDDLNIEAHCISNSDNNILYQFSIHANGRRLIDGRAAVILNVDHAEAVEHINPSLHSGAIK